MKTTENMKATLKILWAFMMATATTAVKVNPAASHEDIEIEQFPVHLQTHECMEPLGMESGNITDDQISVSTSINSFTYGKENARLNSNSAWVTKAVFSDHWIQINFIGQRMVSAVSTQGKTVYQSQSWISTYQVQYKVNADDTEWKTITKGSRNTPRIFQANTDANSVVTRTFDKPVQAEVIRIIPTSWPRVKNRIALRLELLGCQVEQSGCDSPKVLTRRSGYISSMNHPGFYNNNANCVWEITAPETQAIVLKFLTFALEGFNNCPLEYVEVYDVIGEREISLGKFCGKVTPPKFVSSSNLLKVHFMSDHFESDVGFKAHYQFYNGSGCGGPRTLDDQEGQFHSKNYPQNYDGNLNCEWDITVEPGKLIEITFDDLQIAEGSREGNDRDRPRCGRDNLQIHNIGTGRQEGIPIAAQQYCGHHLPKNFVSKSNRLLVDFQTDRYIADKGFNATYRAVAASGCGGKKELTDPTGALWTLNYPQFYPAKLKCEWNIIAHNDPHIELTFNDFNLEGDHDCRWDHVSIYDGLSDTYLLGKYCNLAKLQPLVAHSGSMKIIFMSDKYNQHRGFNASYVIKPYSTSTQISYTSSNQQDDTTTQSSRTTKMETTHNAHEKDTTEIAITMVNKNSTKPTAAGSGKLNEDKDKGKEPTPKVVTVEMAKWIMIGLAAVTGLLIMLVVVGVILCCRQHATGNSAILQGSFRNANNSSVVQNHAYDFDFPSTNHSIRSRQVGQTESPQVSETFSQQGTLQRAPSRESHIYFSIEECNNSRQQREIPVQVTSKNLETPNIKVHFKKQASDPKLMCGGSDESTTMQSEEDIGMEDYTDDDTYVEDSTHETDEPGRSSRCNTIERTIPFRNLEKTKSQSDGPKMMVDNILYESADSMDQD